MEGARRATEGDLGTLVGLAARAADELRAARGGELWWRREARPDPVDDSWRASLTDPDQLVLVGTIDGCPVGFGAARLAAVSESRGGGVVAVVGELYVEPEARGVGVGEAVMDALVAWAEDRGCLGIESLALPGMRDTKNFFEGFGLVARALVVYRPLGPTAGAEPPAPEATGDGSAGDTARDDR